MRITWRELGEATWVGKSVTHQLCLIGDNAAEQGQKLLDLAPDFQPFAEVANFTIDTPQEELAARYPFLVDWLKEAPGLVGAIFSESAGIIFSSRPGISTVNGHFSLLMSPGIRLVGDLYSYKQGLVGVLANVPTDKEQSELQYNVKNPDWAEPDSYTADYKQDKLSGLVIFETDPPLKERWDEYG